VKRLHVLLLALLAILATPVASQDEPVYFSLNSSRTYAPGEKPTVQLWASGVESLEFRVYRVKDPLAFFEKLEDVHRFGGQAPALPRERTLLERFHWLKRRWQVRVRNLFRAQFSAENRTLIRHFFTDREPPPARSRVTTYAQVPLLNQQQVVAVWRQALPQVSRWNSLTVPLEVTDKGLYLVEAVHGELRAYTVVLVTGMAVVTKTAPGRTLSYVVDRQSGAPLEGATVRVWSNKEEINRQASDAQGLVDTRFEELRPENNLVLAQRGDDFAVDSLYAWHLNRDPDHNLTAYLYTERPVYRPGHTVHWKGILRTQVGADYALPERRDARLQVLDPEGKAIFQETLTVSPLGTINGKFALPATAALGYYSLELHLGAAVERAGFHVEEYRKPEYEVKVTPAPPGRVLQGQPIQATIQARYYFGEPVANAKVTYVVHRSVYGYYRYYDEEYEDEGEDYSGYYGGEQIIEETGQLDAEGRLTVSIPTEVAERHYDMRYRIEARVTDQANREIAGVGWALATYGSFRLTVDADQYVYQAGQRAGFSIEAKDYDGNPVQTQVQVGLYAWRWDEREERRRPITSLTATTGPDGKAKVQFPVGSGGSFYVRATARTPEGREVEGRDYVWVTGPGATWYGARRERLQIIPDKKSYAPGETARLLIITGTPDANVLVTSEGRELFTHQVVKATGPTVTVEVPIRPEYAPNFYVGAVFLRENQLYQGSKSVTVPPTERQLSIEVASSKADYRPGESGTVTLTARDHAGRPVAGEFSLGVVDEAIYAIRPEAAQDIVRFFYGRVYNRVGTDSSLSYYFYGAAGKRKMQLTGVRRPTSLAQVKPERLVEPKIRKAFPDTILWLAELRTDSSGRAQAHVTFPDSLTTWRVTTRGVTRDTKVGSAVHRTIVRKNLILRLATPRFFTQGDEVQISALVHNYLTTEKTARISLEAEGVEIIAGSTQDIAIPSRGEARVDFRVRAPSGAAGSAREAKLLGKALTDEESDALELTLPVIPFGVKLTEARGGSVTGATGEAQAELKFPREIVPSSKALEVRVAPSVAGTIFAALEYLTSYPYGCVEQTMSSFLPNIVVAQAMKDLGVKANIRQPELDDKIRKGMERLYNFQHDDGGWGWWQTDESHAFMTAYVVGGLVQAREAGYPVRGGALARGASWLREEFKKTEGVLPDVRAYIAYALVVSGEKDRAVLNSVWAERDKMSPYGLALLGLALDAAGDMRADQAAELLERQAKTDDSEAYWETKRDPLLDFPHDSSPEATAHALKLLARRRPQSPLLPKAALWLVNHRDQGYYWSSTKQTAMVIYGLIDYLKLRNELNPDFSVKVWVNDKEVLSRRFSSADIFAPEPPVVRLPAEALADSNRVRISKSGAGVLYWSAHIEYYSTQEKLERMGRVSLNLLREYFRLVPGREKERIVYTLEPLQGTLAPGDVLVVRLTMSGGPWRYLMVEDPIPAGTEFIERDDLYEIKDKPSWWYYWYTRREFHDDHAAMFQTYFSGQKQYIYLLKVVNPGRFRVSPARAQPMYQPQYLTTTESQTVEVK